MTKKPIKLGDFNIPWKKEDHMDTKLMQDTLNLFDLFQNVTLQTHNAETMLDWILVTYELHTENLISDIANQYLLSNHSIIKFKIALPRPPTERITINHRNCDGKMAQKQSSRKQRKIPTKQ